MCRVLSAGKRAPAILPTIENAGLPFLYTPAMQLRLDKPWIPVSADVLAKLPGQLGVYQVADAQGNVLKIGFAGGKSLFGLRSTLQDATNAIGSRATHFRVEVNMQYQTRYKELLMLHIADHGDVPELNRDDRPERLGRLG